MQNISNETPKLSNHANTTKLAVVPPWWPHTLTESHYHCGGTLSKGTPLVTKECKLVHICTFLKGPVPGTAFVQFFFWECKRKSIPLLFLRKFYPILSSPRGAGCLWVSCHMHAFLPCESLSSSLVWYSKEQTYWVRAT